MANFLFIDTASAVATVATSESGKVTASKHCFSQMGQAAEINLMIEEVLQKTGLTMEQVDCFCVNEGPGSYTGLRVGMSVAKGMAFALNKPIICFNQLQSIALSYQQQNPQKLTISVLLFARKGEYFWGAFNPAGQEIEPLRHLFKADLKEKVLPDHLVITDAPDLQLENKMVFLEKNAIPDLQPWIKIVSHHWENKAFADVAYAEPLYLKAAFTTQPKKML